MSVPLRSAAGRGALTASILGSGMAFLDGRSTQPSGA
jgi:hypothetical protein